MGDFWTGMFPAILTKIEQICNSLENTTKAKLIWNKTTSKNVLVNIVDTHWVARVSNLGVH